MGSNSSSGGGGGGNQQAKARRLMTTTPNYGKPKKKSVTSGTLSDPREKDDTAAKLDMFNKGKKGNAKGTLAIINPLLTKGSEVTRNFYTTRVLKDKDLENFKSKSVTEQEAQYKSYLDGRLSGKTDAMGREIISTGSGGENQVVQAPLVATTMPVEELPQQVKAPESVMTSEEARAKANLLLKKRRGKRTRGSLIATSPQGITDDEGLTLGKKSLLG